MTGEQKPVSLPWLHKNLRCCCCNKMRVRVILLSNKDICFDIQRKMSFQIFGVMFQLSYIFTYLYPKYFPFPVTSYHLKQLLIQCQFLWLWALLVEREWHKDSWTSNWEQAQGRKGEHVHLFAYDSWWSQSRLLLLWRDTVRGEKWMQWHARDICGRMTQNWGWQNLNIENYHVYYTGLLVFRNLRAKMDN